MGSLGSCPSLDAPLFDRSGGSPASTTTTNRVCRRSTDRSRFHNPWFGCGECSHSWDRATWSRSAIWTRQLGDRSRRRRLLWLHAALRHHAVEPDGDSPSSTRCQPRHCHWPGSRSGLPGLLSKACQFTPLDRLRTGNHGLRPGGNDRHRDRAATPVSYSPDRRRVDHRTGRLPSAFPDEQRISFP